MILAEFLVPLLLLCSAAPAACAPTLSGFRSKAEARQAFEGPRMALRKREADSLRPLFEEWKQQLGISYPTLEEDTRRYQIFIEAVRKVVANNNNDTTTFWSGLNQYSAMTPEEARAALLSPRAIPPVRLGDADARARARRPSTRAAYPAAKDWQAEGFVTPVKNQGNCGSCWAFAGVAAIEARLKIQTNQDYDLSEQQVVECQTTQWGCGGGWPKAVLQYAASNFLQAEEDYSYSAGSCSSTSTTCGIACPTDKLCRTCQTAKIGNVGVQLSGSGFGSTDEVLFNWYCQPASGTTKEEMMEALYTHGPLAIAFNVLDDFFSYDGGIYNKALGSCGNAGVCPGDGYVYVDVNHAVLLVGYDSNQKFWKLKNSWGSLWGESGYFRMSMSDGVLGTCQMYAFAGYWPTVATDTSDPCRSIQCTTPPSKCHNTEGTCVDGVCEYTEKSCTAPPNKCHLSPGTCDPTTGLCVYTKNPCDQPPSSCHNDTGACALATGICSYTLKTCGTPPSKCHNTQGTCVDGICEYTEKSCTTPPSKCHLSPGTCDPTTGLCSYTKNPCDQPPSACHNDIGACSTTTGICSYTLKTCRTPPSKCHNTVGSCSDGDSDCVYTEKVCTTPPNKCYEATGTCNPSTGLCSYTKIVCDDPPSTCHNSPGTCNTRTGACTYTLKTCRTPPNKCYITQGTCVDGECIYSEKACIAPPNKCYETTGTCNPSTGLCSYTKIVCDDPPSTCHNSPGTCNTRTGACAYTLKTCRTPPTKCHVTQGSCVDGECVYTEKVCSAPPSKCTEPAGTCNPSTGSCGYVAKVCNSPATDCYNSAGTCSTTTGLCTYRLKAKGAACSDGICDVAGNCISTG